MLGREALVVLVNLSRLMAANMDEPIFHVRDWINSWIAIAVSRSYSHIIHRSRLPSLLQDWDTDWDPASGLGLAQYIAHIFFHPYDPLPPLIHVPRATTYEGRQRKYFGVTISAFFIQWYNTNIFIYLHNIYFIIFNSTLRILLIPGWCYVRFYYRLSGWKIFSLTPRCWRKICTSS